MPKHFPEWVKTQPDDRNPHRPDLAELEVETIETRAGDLLIWNSQLPHGVSPNQSDRPRLAQYISMSPAQEQRRGPAMADQSWMHRMPPTAILSGDPARGKTARNDRCVVTVGTKAVGLIRGGRQDSESEGDMQTNQERGRTRATPGFAS
ncbi:MAG: hypothetical protein CM1200mP2_31330 [Planctomycetaceae bacterium]|nr:MAG: hypothetical protein CM1200mP2_31330 [Planctomycetaceae bacterium]